MNNAAETPQLDLGTFELSSLKGMTIGLPAAPAITEEEIDSQLFQYVASAGKGSRITSIADLDDAWVQGAFDGLSSTAELRSVIRKDLEKQDKSNRENLKFRKCSDALVEALKGDIDPDTLESSVELSRIQYDEKLRSFGMSRSQYLHKENLSPEQFEERLREDVLFQLKFNVALDKVIELTGASVAEDEITQYLSCEDPDTFLAEVEKEGKLYEARRAAARVKVMRSIVDSAVVIEME